ncbi:hypothetical protein [Halanaeroarchaeum sp. HSR-CO]|uniref:DUF7284 family protein n=1 Tax=Halanaeroarchaeum sp. HSR-CO TaxID=2866382 RepID=UPI00217E8DA1|nr:hypothetical protein [Halanaeroarchaeum sp. HSR-CO]
MNRGISTVLDVGFAIVLVGASVAVLAGVPATGVDQQPAVHASGGVAVAGSTMTVEYEREDDRSAVVTRTVAGHVRDAAIARDQGVGEPYVSAVEADVADRIAETGTRTQIVGACVEDGRASTMGPETRHESADAGQDAGTVVAGPAPPTGAPVDATVYRWNESAVPTSTACQPVVVVRSWSP